LIAALLVSLGGFAARMLRARCVAHPSVVDVAMRDVIDFPLRYTSLCRYLTAERAKEFLGTETTPLHLVAAPEVDSLTEFVRNGRDFYFGLPRG
jgi:hypothetical protein